MQACIIFHLFLEYTVPSRNSAGDNGVFFLELKQECIRARMGGSDTIHADAITSADCVLIWQSFEFFSSHPLKTFYLIKEKLCNVWSRSDDANPYRMLFKIFHLTWQKKF